MDKTLLVALDFGETTDSIMDHAAQLAIGLEAAVHLVHAVEFTPYETDDNVTAMTKMVREIEHQLDQYAARLRSVGAEVDGHQVGIGRAHRIILSIAERHDVCGIVLGAGSKIPSSRGRLTRSNQADPMCCGSGPII
jgi:nucleotide-binding universal stress UspA family protein